MKRAVALRRNDAPDAGRYHPKSERTLPTRERANGNLKGLSRCGKGPNGNGKWVSRLGTGRLKIKTRFPDAGQAFGKRFGAFPTRDRRFENENIVVTIKNKHNYD